MPNVRVLVRTTAFGWYDGNVFGAVERVQKHVREPASHLPIERLWRIVAGKALLATGAEERPLVFGGNDRPGVMMAGAMRAYLNRYGVAPGRATAIFTTNDSGYTLAQELEAAGVDVVAIVDSRPAAGVDYRGKARLVREAVVCGTKGGKAISAIEVHHGGRTEPIAVDALAMAGGFDPIIHLACHRGGKPVWSAEKAAFLAPGSLKGLEVAGGAAATTGLAACLGEGAARAEAIVRELGLPCPPVAVVKVESDEGIHSPAPLWSIPGIKDKAFVDFQNDVHSRISAWPSGRLQPCRACQALHHQRHGDGPGQAFERQCDRVDRQGTRRLARRGRDDDLPPFLHAGILRCADRRTCGPSFPAVRKSPLHDWAKKHGAVFVETGLWYRSSWFPLSGERTWRESVEREVLNVRKNAGLCDVSMLGKIEIAGSDAAEFLNRVYCNAFLKLPVGKARYGLMLREDGFIYDDGTTSRLEENRFFMTTTTAYAAGVMNHLEFCAQVLWPELDVRLASITDHWAQMAIAGPKSRMILQKIVDEDISDAAFPFLAAKEVSLFGGALHGCLFRISFSGELAYELAVPAGYGESIADALLEAGKDHGIMPYGVETLSVLRIEKGHVTHNEINAPSCRPIWARENGFGRQTGFRRQGDASAGGADRARPAAAGGRRAARSATVVPQRLTHSRQGGGSHARKRRGLCHLERLFADVGSTIALALVRNGRNRHGEEVLVWSGLHGESTPARLCNPVFFDPQNERLHV